jgi:hypothetical protein
MRYEPGGVFADVFDDLDQAKVRAAQGAEVRAFCAFLRQGASWSSRTVTGARLRLS